MTAGTTWRRWQWLLRWRCFLVNWLRGREWSQLERRIGTYAIIVVDIQLLLGLVLWGIGASLGIIGANAARTIEHPFTMLLAIIILHAGWVWTKRSDEDCPFCAMEH